MAENEWVLVIPGDDVTEPLLFLTTQVKLAPVSPTAAGKE